MTTPPYDKYTVRITATVSGYTLRVERRMNGKSRTVATVKINHRVSMAEIAGLANTIVHALASWEQGTPVYQR
jgi:hypothetical protein